MGVDYTGHYGFGIKIKTKEFEEDSEYFEGFGSYLDDIIEDKDFYYFETGEGSYTGEGNDFYICVKKPLEYGYDLSKKSKDLIDFLNNNKIEFEGEVDVVGGLEIW